jgi:hypothetical protein
VDKFRSFIRAATGNFLWAVILVPILAISWIGFYTIARGIGVPPVFAAGMSAAFDGVALFAARIGLKHRRKGFSGYLARITVIAFAALGAFVQSFHGESQSWIHAHSWIVWATAPVAAVLAYELHLGWVHRKQLIAKGYTHPSAKSGFGPATWLNFPTETLHEYRAVLRERRAFITRTNLQRFVQEESEQPSFVQPILPLDVPAPAQATEPATDAGTLPAAGPSPARTPKTVRASRPAPKSAKSTRPVSTRPATAQKSSLHSVPSARSASGNKSKNQVIQDWCRDHDYELGFNGRVPIDGLRAYRAAARIQERAS